MSETIQTATTNQRQHYTHPDNNAGDNSNNAASSNSNHRLVSCELIRQYGGQILREFDDGHVPKHLRRNTTHNQTTTELVNYPEFFDRRASQVHVYDTAVEPSLADALYDATLREGRPWGTYVTVESIQSAWRSAKQTHPAATNDNNDIDALSLQIAAAYFVIVLHQQPTFAYTNKKRNNNHHRHEVLFTRDDLQKAHGVAIWALPASTGSSVPYHMDYAEQVRHQTNQIVPPLLAGTLHCTRAKVTGGDYLVHVGGNENNTDTALDHYRRHGHKGCKLPVEYDSMKCIPYKYNRMIVQSGHLPHASTRVASIVPNDQKRVIVGLNVFAHDFGPLVQQAPEHSRAFRMQVGARPHGCTVLDVKANPALRHALVLAKRERVRRDYIMATEELDRAIADILQSNEAAVSVERLMRECCSQDVNVWPNATDVQAHIQRQWRQGKLIVECATGIGELNQVSPECMVRVAPSIAPISCNDMAE
jgi:hypothetical protein